MSGRMLVFTRTPSNAHKQAAYGSGSNPGRVWGEYDLCEPSITLLQFASFCEHLGQIRYPMTVI